MPEPLILAAGRSPFGARHGLLAGWHPAYLLAAAFEATLDRAGVDPAGVDEVLVGCATPVGAQASNLAARAVRACAGLDGAPATLVSTQDTSSLMALVRAVDAVRAGRCGTVLVGGVELMSTVPAGADLTHRGYGLPAPPPGHGAVPPPGPAAEAWATRRGVDRERLEAVARRSRSRACGAQAAGRFAAELLPVTGWPGAAGGATPPAPADELAGAGTGGPGGGAGTGGLGIGGPGAAPDGGGAGADSEGPGSSGGPGADEAGDDGRPGAQGLYSQNGLLTAATVAPMADGAAAAVVASPLAASRWGAEPVARVLSAAAVGGDPRAGCGTSPQAAERVLAAAGLRGREVDRVELAELFATSVVHWEFAHPDLAGAVNPDGGSLALGHPQGATGLGLVARLVRALAGLPAGARGVAACDAVDGHGAAVLLGT